MVKDPIKEIREVAALDNEAMLCATILRYGQSGHATPAMIEAAIGLIERHITYATERNDQSWLDLSKRMKASLQQVLIDGVHTLRAPRPPGPEITQVELPLARFREGLGHKVYRQRKCSGGIIDIFDASANQLIECKAVGTSAALGEAAGQLNRYRPAFPDAEPCIAVLRLEPEGDYPVLDWDAEAPRRARGVQGIIPAMLLAFGLWLSPSIPVFAASQFEIPFYGNDAHAETRSADFVKNIPVFEISVGVEGGDKINGPIIVVLAGKLEVLFPSLNDHVGDNNFGGRIIGLPDWSFFGSTQPYLLQDGWGFSEVTDHKTKLGPIAGKPPDFIGTAEEIGAFNPRDVFSGSFSRVSDDCGVERQKHRRQCENDSGESQGIIDRFADKPRNGAFICLVLGFLCCAVGVAFNLNTRMRWGCFVGNGLTVIGVLTPLWLPLLIGAVW